MKIEYKLVDTDEVVKNKLPHQYISANIPWTYEDDFRSHLYRFEDGVAIEHIASDGGEPEDQSFYRDLKWVVDELKNAYLLGLKHGSVG